MKTKKIDGASFNVDAVKNLSKESFIEIHMCFRPDLSEKDRKKWLSGAYSLITKPEREENTG